MPTGDTVSEELYFSPTVMVIGIRLEIRNLKGKAINEKEKLVLTRYHAGSRSLASARSCSQIGH